MTAFEGREVDGLQGHTATGDKFVLERRTTGNLIFVIQEDIDQTVDVLLVQFRPTYGSPLPQSLLQQIRPQTLLQTERRIG